MLFQSTGVRTSECVMALNATCSKILKNLADSSHSPIDQKTGLEDALAGNNKNETIVLTSRCTPSTFWTERASLSVDRSSAPQYCK